MAETSIIDLKKGQKAPVFSLENAEGDKISLSDFLGKTVVLYFYPKDMTPGCTVEACDFRDLKAKYTRKKAVVLGISKDSVSSHQKFIAKQNLNFELLSDPDGKVCEKYKVWREKKNYGKTYMGIVRSTFIIDPEGKIREAIYNVKVKDHAEEILNII